jgi:hypothetical protein
MPPPEIGNHIATAKKNEFYQRCANMFLGMRRDQRNFELLGIGVLIGCAYMPGSVCHYIEESNQICKNKIKRKEKKLFPFHRPSYDSFRTLGIG